MKPGTFFLKKMALVGVVLILQLVSVNAAGQQTINVRGTVLDETDTPLPGAAIMVTGTTEGVATDLDGNFIFPSVPLGATLTVSSIGMRDVQIIANSEDLGIIVMPFDAIGLNESVAIGYGTTTKKEVTGSVASITSKDFLRGNMASPLGAIQGKIPGLTILNSNGSDPTTEYSISIRGLNSFSGGKEPLIIVDGVVWEGSLSMISQDEIASIDILKDGSAAAIYGTRATNGVILITTKRPEAGDVKFDFSAYVSIEQVNKNTDWMDASDYRNAISKYYPDYSYLDKGADTDWMKVVSRTPVNQNYSLTLSGGKGNIAYRTNLYYKNDQGIFKKSSSSVLSPSIYITQKAFDNRLNIDYKLLYSRTNNQTVPGDLLYQTLTRNPTEPVYDENGEYYENRIQGSKHPLAMLNESDYKSVNQYVNASVNADLMIVKGLYLKFSAAYNVWANKTDNYDSSKYPSLGSKGKAYIAHTDSYNYVIEPSLFYKLNKNGHNFTVAAGYSFSEWVNTSSSMTNRNFDTDIFGTNNIGAGSDLIDGMASMTSEKSSNRLIAFYARATYNYKDKYLASVSVREEGSSRFGANNKWGTFPALSIGWRMNEEPWMKNIKWIDNLKLRAGVGVTGNQDIPNYQSLARLALGNRLFYYDGSWMNVYVPANNPNPDLKWEIKTEYNLGVDIGLFNRLSVTVDLYHRQISDLLWWYNVPVPPNVYDNIYANVGSMSNRGYEISINADVVKTRNFLWNSVFGVSQNRNRIDKLSDASRGYELDFVKLTPVATTWAQLLREGDAVGNFWAPVYKGVDESGMPVYEDVNGDGTVDTNSIEDRKLVGNEYPKAELSWSNNFSYRNFYFSISMRALLGQSLINWDRLSFTSWSRFQGGNNILKSAEQDLSYNYDPKFDDRFVDDASFLKIDNIVIGYAFKVKKVSFDVYLSGNNLFTFTKFDGSDPERIAADFNTDTEKFGGTNLTYPYSRSFILGLKLNF